MADPVASMHMFRDYLKRYMGRNRVYPFLEYHSMDVAKWEDDFVGDEIDGKYTVTNGGGASVASFAVSAGVNNGIIRATTGTANDNTASANLTLGLHYRADQSCTAVVRLTASAITGKIEFGFADILDAGLGTANEGIIATQATPTFDANVTDAVLWSFDTTEDANWHCIGVDAGTATTTIDPAIAPVAATYEYLMIEMRAHDENPATSTAQESATARFSRFDASGGRTYRSGWMSSETAVVSRTLGVTLLTPWLYIQGLDGTGFNLDVDYLAAWQRRT